MKTYARDKNRKPLKVKSDVESTKKIVREDIYDIIKDTKTKEEATQEVKDFIDDLNSEATDGYTKQHGSLVRVANRIISDLDSYGVKWDE